MKRFLREPLLHFLLIGAALFAIYSLKPKSNGDVQDTIVVSSGQIERLTTTFAKMWQRPPTEAELKGIIDEWVREEMATREAIALGLDRDDSVIRRRLRQKLEFVAADIAAQTQPTDADLTDYLKAHADKFSTEPRYTLRQVYLDPSKHGANLTRDAESLLSLLKSGESDAAGDPFLLDNQFSDEPQSELGKQFGQDFATKLKTAPIGQWSGPMESGYGLHLVLVEKRTEGTLPPLADVRSEVLREWTNALRVDANAKFYDGLLKRYTVTIEAAKPATDAAKVVQRP